ncbi:MAG: sugar transferase [Alphaproteobacteria bacterium]|nr:sugar transferase [Alphaproteobacteria bacterium]
MKILLFFIVIFIAIFFYKELKTAYYISRQRQIFISENQLQTPKMPPILWRILKRSGDIVISLAVCITVLPVLYVFLGAIIKLTSKGPIVFKQKRRGLFGKEFVCYKFRSMYIGVADRKATINDERVTPIGKLIRKTHLDEFPQFYNVLTGDMSLVGPRPLPDDQVKLFAHLPQKKARFLIRPGITGLAQIHSGRELPPEEYLAYDLEYIFHHSLFEDVRLIMQTLKFSDISY